MNKAEKKASRIGVKNDDSKRMGSLRAGSRVAVVGAGPGGLAAAVLLAARGLDVTVFETRSTIGGRNGKLSLGEFSFDIGPTFLLMPSVLEGIFTKAGRKMSDFLDLHRIDPMYTLLFSDGTSFQPRDNFSEMQAALQKLSPSDADRYPKYYAYMDRKLSAMLPILSTPYLTSRDLLSVELLKAAPYLRPDRSLAGELKAFFKDERTQLSFGFQAKYLGMSPYDCPSLFSILNFIEQKYGIWHPKGGLNAITDALAKLAISLGVEIKTGAPVQHVFSKNGKVTSIIAGDEEFKADYFVVNADISHFLSESIDKADRKKYSDEKLRTLKYSCSTFMLYMGVKGKVPLGHHTIVFSENYKRYLKEISETGTLPEDPSFYVCNPSVTDPTLAPEGKSAIYILSPVPNLKIGSIDWEKEHARYRSILLNAIQKKLGVALEDIVEVESQLSPIDWRDQYNIAYGAVFNLQHSLDQLLILRPRNQFEEFENMYLVGGSTHPGSGLPTILQSAQICCDLILKREGLASFGASVLA